MALSKPVKGWFTTQGRPGDRTLEDQLKGLDWLLANCFGKTVLDVGCAEGLLSIELAKRGALAVHGVEIVADHVKVGQKLQGALPICFEVGDANTWTPPRRYNIVIMLALLQKLRNPTEACHRLAAAASEAVVLRLPPANAPTIIDDRSGNNPHHTDRVMHKLGFKLYEENYDGHFGEYVAIWKRI